jgi:CTP:molybdopterin cytidylyltransferase MocA
MGGPKADLVVDGRRLIDRAAAAMVTAGCDPVYAVVRSGTSVSGARSVVNQDPNRGLLSSLLLAVEAAASSDALAVLLVDMPGVTAQDVAAVVAGWRPGRIALARYPERSGHPVVMSIGMWRDALALAGPDDGARNYLGRHADLVDEIDVAGSSVDLDTSADLDRWRERS